MGTTLCPGAVLTETTQEVLTVFVTPMAHHGSRKERTGSPTIPFTFDMALFVISVPLMIAAVAVAVVPLLALSRKHHRHTATVTVDTATEQHDDEEPALPMAA